jgi:hypothetical protein
MLSFVRFSYQFISVICLLVQCVNVKLINFILLLHLYFRICILFKWLCWMVTVLWGVSLERIVLDGNCVVGCELGTDCVGW